MKAILVVGLSGREIIEDVDWVGTEVLNTDMAARLFFSEEFKDELEGGLPNMDVHLVADPSVTSRVNFAKDVGELYSSINLTKAVSTRAEKLLDELKAVQHLTVEVFAEHNQNRN